VSLFREVDAIMRGPQVLATWIRDRGVRTVKLDTPSVRVYNSAAQSIPNNTTTALTFNTELHDTHQMHSTTSNTGRLTCTIPGVYYYWAMVEFNTNNTGVRDLRVLLNGSTIIGLDRRPTMAANEPTLCVVGEYKLSVGDYLSCSVTQNSGGNLDINSTARFTPDFGMHWVSNG
jgi:hypothetical protein